MCMNEAMLDAIDLLLSPPPLEHQHVCPACGEPRKCRHVSCALIRELDCDDCIDPDDDSHWRDSIEMERQIGGI